MTRQRRQWSSTMTSQQSTIIHSSAVGGGAFFASIIQALKDHFAGHHNEQQKNYRVDYQQVRYCR